MNIRQHKRAVVIGSGFGGLAAAVRLGARGYRVTVCERLDMAGGKAAVWRQDGYTFDAGPTIITAPFLFEELWALAGRRLQDDVELLPMDPFYRIRFDDGSQLDCSADAADMKRQIRAFCAADEQGYDRFLDASRAIFEIGFEQLAHVPFSRLTSMLKVVPDLARLRSDRSVYALADRCFSDPRLKLAFSFHPLLVGGNPLTTTSIYSLIAFLERRWGVHFVRGGTGELVKGLLQLIAAQGGEVRLNTPVENITVAGGGATGVRLASGETLPADVVVSNADSAATYLQLLPGVRRQRWTDRKLARQAYSMSLFVWYFGTNRRYDNVPHHMMLMGPRYRALLKDIFERKVLADDFSLYLHRPTATDPNLAPPGHDAFYVLSPVPHLDADLDWTTRAESYRASIAQRLEETVLPGLSQCIDTSRIMTPLDFRDRYAAPKGAAFGLAPEFSQSAWFRPHNASEEVDNLFLVGAGTHPGAGVPGVLSSARVLDTVVPHA